MTSLDAMGYRRHHTFVCTLKSPIECMIKVFRGTLDVCRINYHIGISLSDMLFKKKAMSYW